MPRRTRIAISLLALVLSAFGQDVTHGSRAIGAGAFPLSFTDASAWFAQRADNDHKVLTVILFLQGTPGWLNEKTDFRWQVNQDPATIDMMVGKVPIRAKYWANTDEIEIQEKKYKRSVANVLLVSRIDEVKPTVTPLGVHDLAFKPEEVPPVTLLKRDADIWAALTGHSPGDHPSRKKQTVSSETLAWDAEGLRLLEVGKPDEERKGCELFRRAALKGYAPSQYRLGYCYESGRGVPQNFSTANEWYEKAAVQGHTDAQYKLAHSYRTGRGVKIDLVKALAWYMKAAASGDRDALHNVAWMYATGQGTKADQQEAYRWFLRAAEHGETNAQFEVARRLRAGEGSLFIVFSVVAIGLSTR